MERYIVRFVKPVALSAICFISMYYLTKSLSTAIAISLIPLLLGWLGIMEFFAYATAATVFLAAVFWAITPIGVKTAVQENSGRAIEQIKNEMTAR